MQMIKLVCMHLVSSVLSESSSQHQILRYLQSVFSPRDSYKRTGGAILMQAVKEIYLSLNCPFKYCHRLVSFPLYCMLWSIYGSTVVLLDLDRFFSCLIIYIVGMTPWMRDQLVSRQLHTQNNTNTEETHTGIHAPSGIQTHNPSA
jgi:hypothetical protein